MTPWPIHSDGPAAYAKSLDAVNVASPQDPYDTRYWSAFVHLEAQDITDLWNIQWGDYLLISAQVKIPTRGVPLVRDFPLFLVQDGQVQVQSGVDLLRKLPISTRAREQIGITIEVRYIKGAKYLEITKKILKEAARAAEPFLNNYPVASKLVGTAIPMLDQILPENSKRTPSSRTMMIEPAHIARDHTLLAFILKPTRLPLTKQGTAEAKQSQEESCKDKRSKAIPETLQCTRVVECTDAPGMLCSGGKLDEFITKVRQDRGELRQYATSSAPYRELDKLTERRDALLARMANLRGASAQQQQQQPRVTSSAELKELESELMAVDKQLQELAPAASATSRPSPPSLTLEDPLWLYQQNRLQDAAYLTIDFRSYDGVWDPMLLIRDAHSDCDRISAETVKVARDYLVANDEMFTADDSDMARRQFALADLFVAMRDNLTRRDFGAVMNNLDQIFSQHGQTSPDTPVPAFSRAEGDPLGEHYDALFKCTVSQMARAPMQYVYRLWGVYHHLSSDGFASQDRCPALATDEAFRLDLLDIVLSDFSYVAGEAYDYRGRKSQKTKQPEIQVTGHVVRQLDAEAASLLEQQERLTFAGECKTDPQLQAHSGTISLACSDCWEKLTKHCKAIPDAAQKVQSLMSKRRAIARSKLDDYPTPQCDLPGTP